MTITIETVTPQKLLELAQSLNKSDQRWLIEQLNGLVDQVDEILLEQAIQGYLNNSYNSSQAAQVAGLSREKFWEVVDKRGLFLERYGHHTRAEVKLLERKMERDKLWNWYSDAPGQGKGVITLSEAIALFLTDKCSLGRAAELAGGTRWNIIDSLQARDIPVYETNDLSATEIDSMVDLIGTSYGYRE